jgi:DNA polymerase III subunit gamma/tau
MYSPNSARFKVYIIDEVHMLSNAAFNALLKTLEEPPENVKFIFATTEIKKIPATIISRCQRFDLQKVDIETLKSHLIKICEAENIKFENDSIFQICKASQGSVRDALSLLDQAASLCQDNIKDQVVLNMLGLNGYEKNIQLIELCLLNNCDKALKLYSEIIDNGIQPDQIISNLLEVCHLASKLNVIKVDKNIPELIQKDILNISSFGLPKLVKAWQILIKSIEELRYAPNEEQSGSMTIIKLCFASILPDPAELLDKLSSDTNNNEPSLKPKIIQNAENKNDLNFQQISDVSTQNEIHKTISKPNNIEHSENNDNLNLKDTSDVFIENEIKKKQIPANFEKMLDLLLEHKEALLHAQLINNVHLVSYKAGSIKLRLKADTDIQILKKLSLTLEQITNDKWSVLSSEEEGDNTIVEKQNIELDEAKEKVKSNKEVAAVFKYFPEAEIISIKNNY